MPVIKKRKTPTMILKATVATQKRKIAILELESKENEEKAKAYKKRAAKLQAKKNRRTLTIATQRNHERDQVYKLHGALKETLAKSSPQWVQNAFEVLHTTEVFLEKSTRL